MMPRVLLHTQQGNTRVVIMGNLADSRVVSFIPAQRSQSSLTIASGVGAEVINTYLPQRNRLCDSKILRTHLGLSNELVVMSSDYCLHFVIDVISQCFRAMGFRMKMADSGLGPLSPLVFNHII